jgi:hypothetical protein
MERGIWAQMKNKFFPQKLGGGGVGDELPCLGFGILVSSPESSRKIRMLELFHISLPPEKIKLFYIVVTFCYKS